MLYQRFEQQREIFLPEHLKIGAASSAEQSEGYAADPVWRAHFRREMGDNVDFGGHWNNWQQDYDLLINAGLQTFRYDFASWSRMLANFGNGERGLDQYMFEYYWQRIKYLIQHGVTPLPTLWHWDTPPGTPGLESLASIDIFTNFVHEFLAEVQRRGCSELGLQLHEIFPKLLVINEPNVYAGNTRLLGLWPPYKKDVVEFMQVLNNLAQIVANTYDIAKSLDPNVKVGISQNVANYYPYQNGNIVRNIANKAAVELCKWYDSRMFFGMMSRKHNGSLPVDFNGINYWHSWETDVLGHGSGDKWLSEEEWHIDPEGLPNVLKRMDAEYGLPISLTEVGAHFDDERDAEKMRYLQLCLEGVVQADQQGIQIDDFCWWGPIDVNEWGHVSHSGFVRVEESNQERILRPSYKFIQHVAQNRHFTIC